MPDHNKATLEKANAAIRAGNNEGFLALCTDDIEWAAVGGMTLHGKDAVRQWMVTAYAEPPDFTVDQLIADGDFVAAYGTIAVKKEGGSKAVQATYCDLWRFRGGKMAELKAFVIEPGTAA